MALIELNLDRPALKRTELVQDDREAEAQTDERTDDDDEESKDVPVATEDDSRSTGGKIKRAVRLGGTLAVAAIGAVTLKKLRDRRRSSGDDDTEFDL